MAAQCFDGMIGITRKEGCPCYDDGITAGYRSSTYGLFLDELDGGITLDSVNSVRDCGGTLLSYFTAAIAQAKQFFTADLLADLAMRYKTTQDPFTGSIGATGFVRSRILQASSTVLGVRLEVHQKLGAYFTLSKISLALDQTLAGITARLYRVTTYREGDQITLVKEFTTLASTANSLHDNALSEADTQVLPLWSSDGAEFYYLLVLDRSTLGTATVKDNQNRCNCGRAEMRMLAYFNPIGVEGVVADQLEPTEDELKALSTSYTVNGVVIYGDARCGSDDVICDAIDISKAVALASAYAQWYKAGALLINKVLASPEINKYTMGNRDFLMGRKNHFEKQYYERIRWIGENIQLSGTDCYSCDEDKHLRVGKILS